MYVLVAYATRRGPTPRIAEHIATRLREEGTNGRAEPVTDVKTVASYGAVVLGGATHSFDWLDSAVRFARKHRRELATKPVWLFSSSPLGGEPQASTLTSLVQPRGHRLFADPHDAWDEVDAWVGEIAAELRASI